MPQEEIIHVDVRQHVLEHVSKAFKVLSLHVFVVLGATTELALLDGLLANEPHAHFCERGA